MNIRLLKGVLYVMVTFVVITALYFILLSIGFLSEVPNPKNLLSWDGSWYSSIVHDGYSLSRTEQSNTGFFPGFPYLWSILGMNVFGITVLNFLLFLTGAYLLKTITKSNSIGFALIVAIPSTFFFYLPYAEALFYFCAVLLIISWQNKRYLIVGLCGIMMSFVRPAFFFLIPAVIGILLLSKKPIKELKPTIIITLSLVAGAFFGFLVIGFEVGDLFAYSKSQINHWEHEFKAPSFPLTTWRGYRILWLDGIALFLTIVAFFGLAIDFIRVRFRGLQSYFTNIEIVGLGYLLMILVYVLFFHPVENERTTILSMNRYVFCNPFLHFLILKRLNSMKISLIPVLVIVFAALLTVLLLGFPYAAVVQLDFAKSQVFLLGLLGVFLVLSSLLFKLRMHRLIAVTFILSGILLQLYLYNSFIKGNWIG